MKKQINLIPLEMAVPAKAVSLAKSLNKISTVAIMFLILITVSLISAFVYFKLEFNKASESVRLLKTKIVQLEKNEQKLILAKDKLSKIAYIKGLDTVDNEFLSFEDLQNQFAGPIETTFSEITIDPKKTETSLIIPDSSSLTTGLESLYKILGYKKIILSSLGFNPSSGYLISLILED